MAGHGPVGGKQGQLPGLLHLFVKGLDRPAPGFVLAVVDLAEIKHLALDDLAAGAALAFHNAPIAVLLAVLQASIRSQIHREPSLHQGNSPKRYLVSTTRDSGEPLTDPTQLFALHTPQNRSSTTPVLFGVQIWL